MIFILWGLANAAKLTVEITPPQSFTLKVLRGGNYACLDVPQENMNADFKYSGNKASAQVKTFKGVLVTVMATGETVTDCANVMIDGSSDQQLKIFLLTNIKGDTVVLQHEDDVAMNLFAEFEVGDEYCLASYLQPVCMGAVYSTPAPRVQMITLEEVKGQDYLWFLDGVATIYSATPQPVSAAKYTIKYYNKDSKRPVAALRQPYIEKGTDQFVSWLAFCSDGDGKVAYFGAWFNDKDLNGLDQAMPVRGDAQFPDTRYCRALWQQINS